MTSICKHTFSISQSELHRHFIIESNYNTSNVIIRRVFLWGIIMFTFSISFLHSSGSIILFILFIPFICDHLFAAFVAFSYVCALAFHHSLLKFLCCCSLVCTTTTCSYHESYDLSIHRQDTTCFCQQSPLHPVRHLRFSFAHCIRSPHILVCGTCK